MSARSSLRKRIYLWCAPVAHWMDRTVAGRVAREKSLVISGFPRSGTTWVQQSMASFLGAKTVYEPFHHMAPSAGPIHAAAGIASKSVHCRELFMPFCRPGQLADGPLRDAWADSLRSVIPGRAARVLRSSLGESLRSRVVVKFVRGHLSLRAAQDAFSMPLIHVYRDPRAVVASIRLTDWAWLYDHLRLREQLLDVDDGRADYFGAWRDEILEYDRRDAVARIAAYWALTEKYLAETYRHRNQSAAAEPAAWFLSYEHLCASPQRLLAPILDWLGVALSADQMARALVQDSDTTSRKRVGSSRQDRLQGWARVLTPEEIKTIESTVAHFGWESRLQQAAVCG